MESKLSRVLDRRKFVKQTCCWMGLGAGLSLLESCKPDIVNPKANFSIDLSASSSAALQTIGGAIVKNGIIIIRESSSLYVALSSVCTHASCTVNYNGSSTQLVCPCHGSVFNNSGLVLQGPASSPLHRYSVSVSGNTLTVT